MTVTAPPARGAITAGEPIRLTSVNKTYTTATGPLPVLQDIDLHIETGEFVSLVGPSGCGKSTLLKIIAGLIPFDNGTVHVGEQAPKEGRRDVGFMLQQSVLMPWLSVRENVTLPFAIAREKGGRVGQAMREAIGTGIDVERFVTLAVTAHGGYVEQKKGNLELHLPRKASFREAVLGVGSDRDLVTARFEMPVSGDVLYLSRTHPFVEGLAGYVMDAALDPLLEGVAQGASEP